MFCMRFFVIRSFSLNWEFTRIFFFLISFTWNTILLNNELIFCLSKKNPVTIVIQKIIFGVAIIFLKFPTAIFLVTRPYMVSRTHTYNKIVQIRLSNSWQQHVRMEKLAENDLTYFYLRHVAIVVTAVTTISLTAVKWKDKQFEFDFIGNRKFTSCYNIKICTDYVKKKKCYFHWTVHECGPPRYTWKWH